MSRIISLIKSMAKKKVEVVEEVVVTSSVCSNCESSGRECNVCGGGKDMV